MQHILLLLLALFAVIQGANLSTRYAEKVAESFRMSKYVVGFIVVSFISVLLSAKISYMDREPSFRSATTT